MAVPNIHTHGIRHHRILRRQYAANGQAITQMRIRHQRTSDSHGKLRRVSHLRDGLLVKIRSPLLPGRGRLAWFKTLLAVCRDRLMFGKAMSKLRKMQIIKKGRRISDDRFELIAHLMLIQPGSAHIRGEPLGQFGQGVRDAKIFQSASFHDGDGRRLIVKNRVVMNVSRRLRRSDICALIPRLFLFLALGYTSHHAQALLFTLHHRHPCSGLGCALFARLFLRGQSHQFYDGVDHAAIAR